MYRRPNLSFFLALSLACLFALFADFDGGSRIEDEPIAAEGGSSRVAVQVLPLEIADAGARPVEDVLPDAVVHGAGGQVLSR